MGGEIKQEFKTIVKKDIIESDFKVVKFVKKKVRKFEEIKVDQSMLDLFKLDVDVFSKRKGSVSGKKEVLLVIEIVKFLEKFFDFKRKFFDSDKNFSYKLFDFGKGKKDIGTEKIRKDFEKDIFLNEKVRRDLDKEIKKDGKKGDFFVNKIEKDKSENSDKKGIKNESV